MTEQEGARCVFPQSSQPPTGTFWKFVQDIIDGLGLPTGKDESIVFDDDLPGLGVRIRSSGSRTWIYQYKIGVKHRRITLGAVAALSLKLARKAAGELQAKVRLGRDPASEKAEAQARAAETMSALLKPYLELKRAKLKRGSFVCTERHLMKHGRRLHKLPIAQVDRRAVAATLSFVTSNSGPIEANRVRALLHCMSPEVALNGHGVTFTACLLSG